MPSSNAERIHEFAHRFARAQATEVIELPWGYALLQAEFPYSYWHNRIAITSDVSAAEVIATADEVLGGAGMPHRYVSADDALGQQLIVDFVAAGYEHEPIVTMVHGGPDLEPAPHEVHAASLETLRPAIIRDWRESLPESSDEQLSQLADRTALSARGAALTLLAVYDGDDIAAHADLYVDPVGRVAQFESLVTHTEFQHRGYGDALVRDALRRSRESGCDLAFLTADLNDWPREWYQRLGYVDAGRAHHFTRAG